jgi:hypothetical protein
VRASGGCFVMGQAAGSAAHLALADGKAPNEIGAERLQALLETDGVYLGRSRIADASPRKSEENPQLCAGDVRGAR